MDERVECTAWIALGVYGMDKRWCVQSGKKVECTERMEGGEYKVGGKWSVP